MIFDPKESLSFNGNTGPYLQYMGARISSILKSWKRTRQYKASNRRCRHYNRYKLAKPCRRVGTCKTPRALSEHGRKSRQGLWPVDHSNLCLWLGKTFQSLLSRLPYFASGKQSPLRSTPCLGSGGKRSFNVCYGPHSRALLGNDVKHNLSGFLNLLFLRLYFNRSLANFFSNTLYFSRSLSKLFPNLLALQAKYPQPHRLA